MCVLYYYNSVYNKGAFMSQNKKRALTLAEVLITLGVIGVVAAITIPSLIANYKAHQLRTQFLKSYSTIQQVFRQMQYDEISLDPDDYAHASYYKTFAKYLTGVTDCGLYGNECYKTSFACHTYLNLKKKRGKPITTHLDDGQLLLSDGTVLMFDNLGSNNNPVLVSVDLNGFNSPPNRFGYDVFTFQLIDENIKAMGDIGTLYPDTEKYCSLSSNGSLNGISCAAKARSDADYFKWAVRNLK